MELFKTALMQTNNTVLPISRIVSEMNFSIQKLTNYHELTRIYDPSLALQLKSKGFFDEKIVVIEVEMSPEDMHWLIWKNFQQILQFLQDLKDEMVEMNKVPERRTDKNGKDVGNQLASEHQMLSVQFDKGIGNFSPQLVQRFIDFINRMGQHPYLRKTTVFLIFIEHCVSIDKWNMMIHQQVVLNKPASFGNKMMGLFKKTELQKKSQLPVEYFITITSDGILLSDDHLLLSRVHKMIPFTNQMNLKCYLNGDEDFIYEVTSGRIDKLKFNFYKDYVSGLNFGCGLGRAIKYSGYNFLQGLGPEEQTRHNTFGYNNSNEYSHMSAQQVEQRESRSNRFDSYAQIRKHSNCKMYNDGCGYYEDLYNELMNAEKQVCITGWMITPYFMLKRPANINDTEFRLDTVLSRVAERGVKIFIIVFMEPAMFVNNDSAHVQEHLESLHKNIKVYRHPNVAVPQLWSHHEKLVVIDQKIGFMGGLDICYGRWDTPDHNLVEDEPDPERRLWDGCEFNNYRLKDVYEPRVFWKSNLNKDFQPRMAWHDIAVQIRGDVVIDLLRHFVQYWYFVKTEVSADPRKLFSLLQKRLSQANSHYEKVEKQYILSQMKNDTQETFASKWNSFTEKVNVLVTGEEERISELLIEQRSGMNAGPLDIQMLRSASEWSIGLDVGKHESSIHNAYQNLIRNAKTHIYIENQFFMGLENKIVELLAERIIRAKKEGQKFRVVIVMPLLPGFQGNIADPASTVLRIQVHWQFQAINRSEKSLHSRLFKAGFSRPEIDEYIFFFGLRKGAVLNSVPITEIIYVHSKLMIVDDQRTIIGSANINDRSLLGNRDSEIAICIEQPPNSPERNALEFRQRIYEEHFGVPRGKPIDHLDDTFWHKIIQNAKRNTEIFRECFASIPDDCMKKASDVEPFQASTADVSKWFSLSKELVGHAVEFPLEFMSQEDLTFKPNQKEYYAPDHSFT